MVERYLLGLIETHFKPLFDAHQFEITESGSRMGDHRAFFQNKTTVLRFYSSQLNGYSDLVITFADVNDSGKVGLFSNLLHMLGVEPLPEPGKRSRVFKDLDAFEARVQKKSEQLFIHAADFLAGDFSRLPALLEFQEERAAAARAEYGKKHDRRR